MKQRWLVSAIAAVTLSCVASAADRFDSELTEAYDGVIESLQLITATHDETKLRDEITDQLLYLTGTMIEVKGGADVGHAEIKILSREPYRGSRRVRRVRYSAKLLVGWARGTAVPAGFRLAFPPRLDTFGKRRYYNTFRNTCSYDPSDPDISLESFYYYYRPNVATCNLHKTQFSENEVSYATMALKKSALQSVNKYPEYGKIWQDGVFAATMIFGTDKPGATSHQDKGINQYNQMYLWLRRNFGTPTYMNVWLQPNSLPGSRYPDVEMHWQLSDGRKLDLNILLIKKETLQEADAKFQTRYNERTRHSDFVSYNGHSGFGANIRALAAMGTFLTGQYQLYLINGCATFMYVDDALRKAHQDVNPGSKPYEFFDVITNADLAPFATLHTENALVIKAVVEQHATYREILAQFSPRQTAIVTGEEDNVWKPSQD